MQQNKMTRKQAIERFAKIYGSGHDLSVKWIDFFIETGMLQVEEEKTVEQKFNAAMLKEGFSQTTIEVLKILDNNNLKIVEK
jgi:hypothetical protein